jgi:protein involved in polysaccharide export with SLBB domain
MGRTLPFVTRTAVIACACAMLFLCVLSAHAQTANPAQNDDRYGFTPVPGMVNSAPANMQQPPVAAPIMQVQSAPLGPPGNMPAYAQGYGAPNQGYAPASPMQGPPQYMQNNAAVMQAPMSMQTQGFIPAPAQPYGYVATRPTPAMPQTQGGGYYTAANSRYGTQMAADPNAYYASSANGQNVNSGYLLGPGDKVRVSVYGEEDLSGEYQIDSSGMVRLPLIGTLRAAGFTSPGLENAIAGSLAQGYLKSPKVNVEVSAYRPFYIIGAVTRPGEYPYVANMSALNAVAFGGGFTDQAKQSTVYVRHEGSATEQAMPANQLTKIYPGDVVKVKTTLFWDAMEVFSPLAGPAALVAAAARP